MGIETRTAVAGVRPDEAPAPLEPGELEAVLQICGAFEKTLRVFRLYPSNNRIFIDFTSDLDARFRRFLEAHHELRLDVDEHRLLYGEHPVYEEESRETSIPMRLYRDAIRRLVFFEGLTKDELLGFLDVVTRPVDVESVDDDLVTLLWEKDFAHISYYVLDDPFGEDEEPDLSGDLKQPGGDEDAATEVALEKARAERNDKRAVPRLSARSLSAVMTVTDHDLEVVARMLAHEAARDLRHDLTTALFELLDLDGSLESQEQAVGILGQLLSGYLIGGDVREAGEILRKFREMARVAPSAAHAEIVRGAIRRVAEPSTLRELGPVFEQPVLKAANDIVAFLRLVGGAAVPVLLEILDRTRNPQAVAGILAELCREDPDLLLERLGSANPATLRNLVGIVGAMENPDLAGPLLPHLSHADVAVRLEVVRALGRLGGPDGTRGLLRSLDDPEYQVRVHALRMIEELRVVSLLPHLMVLAERKDFAGRNLIEKQELFRTIARLGGEEALPFLEKTIDARGFLRFTNPDEVRACAAAAMGAIPGAAASSLLEVYSRSSSRAVKEAAEMALRRARAAARGPEAGEESR